MLSTLELKHDKKANNDNICNNEMYLLTFRTEVHLKIRSGGQQHGILASTSLVKIFRLLLGESQHQRNSNMMHKHE